MTTSGLYEDPKDHKMPPEKDLRTIRTPTEAFERTTMQWTIRVPFED